MLCPKQRVFQRAAHKAADLDTKDSTAHKLQAKRPDYDSNKHGAVVGSSGVCLAFICFTGQVSNICD